MGLDIWAYAGLARTDLVCDPIDWEVPDGHWRAHLNPDFPGREDQIVDGAIYTYEERLDCLDMSYGGYNDFREALAKLAGYPAVYSDRKRCSRHDQGAWDAAEGPFWELINFADNEGVIGTAVCAKLSNDFQQFAERAAKVGGWFPDIYARLRAGVDMAAARNGCLDFT